MCGETLAKDLNHCSSSPLWASIFRGSRGTECTAVELIRGQIACKISAGLMVAGCVRSLDNYRTAVSADMESGGVIRRGTSWSPGNPGRRSPPLAGWGKIPVDEFQAARAVGAGEGRLA